METIHLEHHKPLSIGRELNVMACTGIEPFNKSHVLTDKIDNVNCRECFYLWHHSEVKCCGGQGRK